MGPREGPTTFELACELVYAGAMNTLKHMI